MKTKQIWRFLSILNIPFYSWNRFVYVSKDAFQQDSYEEQMESKVDLELKMNAYYQTVYYERITIYI